jgi:hypothetical protein
MPLNSISNSLPLFLFGGLAIVAGFLLAIRSARHRQPQSAALPMEALLSETHRQIRLQATTPKGLGQDRLRLMLREVQSRMRGLPPKMQQRFEKRVMKVLTEAARMGITLSPDGSFQYR